MIPTKILKMNFFIFVFYSITERNTARGNNRSQPLTLNECFAFPRKIKEATEFGIWEQLNDLLSTRCPTAVFKNYIYTKPDKML